LDDSYPWLNGHFLILCFFALYRLVNSLFRAGYFQLGQIYRLSLAEKAGENSGLYDYLNDPLKLNLCAQLFDKLSLLGLIAALYLQVTGGSWGHLLAFFAYLALFDLLLPTAIATYIPEWLVTRLFPLVRVPYAMGLPFALLMCRMVERRRANEQSAVDEDPEDVRAFLRAGTEEGIIEEKEKPLLHNLLNFNDTVVREVMTPRTDMVCVDHSLSIAEILDVFKTTKFSRLPIYNQNIDMIEGLLRYKDVIDLQGGDQDITPQIKQILFVPEQKNISDLLQEMLKKRLQMAVVIDEFGGTAGLITLEDLIEEIVGEIHDEHETPESDEIIPLQNGAYLVDGKVLLDDFAEMFSLDINEEDVDTIGGYIFNHKGHIPKVGETCDIGGRTVEVTKADERRVYQVLVIPGAVGEPAAESQE